MSASIEIDDQAVDVRAGGPAIGRLYLVLDGDPFPSRDWHDFVVVVLGWWANAIRSIRRGESDFEVVRFMDGPYAVEVSSSDRRRLRIRALEMRGRTVERFVSEENVDVFVKSLCDAARKVLSACVAQGWWTADAAFLQCRIDEMSDGSK